MPTFTGAGISLLNASVIDLLILTVEPRDMGLATSMNTVFRNLGGSLGAPIAGSILATYTAPVLVGMINNVPIYELLPTAQAFQYSFYIASALFLATAFVLLFAKEVLGKGAQKIALPTREK